MVQANLDNLNLDVLHDELAAVGYPAGLLWLVMNVHVALFPKRVAPGKAAAARWCGVRKVWRF
ncbi:MAG: hypothetical protein ACOZNI_21470 [Myxococcota bacterium]